MQGDFNELDPRDLGSLVGGPQPLVLRPKGPYLGPARVGNHVDADFWHACTLQPPIGTVPLRAAALPTGGIRALVTALLAFWKRANPSGGKARPAGSHYMGAG